ncbi:unnamed protein product [Owenia fusiformis]|uniref:DNA polymerase n=1 Tax=Owenia fusiformis TaxID=6347 RepID=A0A8J1XU29_OWEFU|nr:unnamed protein product [Owenia fusiformis]
MASRNMPSTNKRKRGKNEDLDAEKCKKSKLEPGGNSAKSTAENNNRFLNGLHILIISAGIQKFRFDIFKKQIIKYGGIYMEKFTDETSHIIVDEKMELDRLCRILKWDSIPTGVKIIKSLWLSGCLKDNNLNSSANFELDNQEFRVQSVKNDLLNDNVKVEPSTSNYSPKNEHSPTKDHSPKKDHSSKKAAYSDADSDYDEANDRALPASPKGHKHIPTEKWVCSAASSDKKKEIPNKNVIAKLEEMAKNYKNSADKWRSFGYQKAIAALKTYNKEITTYEDAVALRGVGKKLADKIWEIIQTGELRKLNEISSTDEAKTTNMFSDIWGVGATTARLWYTQGHRTLANLEKNANLNRQQKVGLRLYDDLKERMTREEAGKIEQYVKETAQKINPGLIAMACGSYRRGKQTCGDVDVLVTHPDGKSHKGVFQKLLHGLHETGFLTDDLVTQDDHSTQQKYLGVCKLPEEGSQHRRLDIIVVPHNELACALMYFTGSAHFNRSCRNLAIAKGMSLSEHSLNTGVIRSHGEKINKGTPLPTPTEESVFELLGIPYRSPQERDH